MTGLVIASVSLTGCASSKKELTTGSIPKVNRQLDSLRGPELARAADAIGQSYERDPKDRNTGLSYANALMMTGRNAQALAVMQQVAISHPSDREVLAALGKAQAAAGHALAALIEEARPILQRYRDHKRSSAQLDFDDLIAALKRLSGSSTIFLLDRTGSGTAKAVAKALAGRGFGRVFLIKGGFQVGRHTRQSVARP